MALRERWPLEGGHLYISWGHEVAGPEVFSLVFFHIRVIFLMKHFHGLSTIYQQSHCICIRLIVSGIRFQNIAVFFILFLIGVPYILATKILSNVNENVASGKGGHL